MTEFEALFCKGKDGIAQSFAIPSVSCLGRSGGYTFQGAR